MIEVIAQLPHRPVYLAGETLECVVTLTNVPRTKRDGTPMKQKPIKVAWVSAQIHCQCSVSEVRVDLPKSPHLSNAEVTTSGTDTSFIPSIGEKGCTVLSKPPTILFCDLTIKPGESVSYTYREVIPIDAPPSFRGTTIKYSYKVTIGAQRFDCPTKLLRVPFRVLVVPGLNDVSVYNEPSELKPSNPFLTKQKESNILDIAMEVLQTMTYKKSINFFNLTNSKGKVAKFCLFKQAYRIGDDIIGICDFAEGQIPCVQFSVTLQSEEIISEECRRKSGQGVTVTSYCKHQEFSVHSRKTHISIPIPLTATPGFVTDVVCLKWRLHFEFVTAKEPLPQAEEPVSSSDSVSWQGPVDIEVETMVWDLPIKVFATSPIHASTVSLLRKQSELYV